MPTRFQGGEEIGLVGQQLVQAAVKLVDLHQPRVLAQEIAHGAGIEPLAMQAPLAAGVEEAVDHQGLQDVQPARALAAGWQSVQPKPVQLQLIPKLTGQPAATPLPRPSQVQIAQANLHHLALAHRTRPGNRAILREQGHLQGPSPAFGENLNGPPPGRLLAVVDLAEIKHLALDHPATAHPPVLHKAPTAVRLAVLAPGLAAEKHAETLPNRIRAGQWGRSALQANFGDFAKPTAAISIA